MSRIRTGITPDAWLIQEPETVRVRARSAYANVPAEVVGNMRPILSYGPLFHEAHTGTDGWRKDSKQR